MVAMPIRKYGDPVLRKRAKEIDRVDDRIRKLGLRMLQTLKEAGGMGLAANQVGVNKKIFIARKGETNSFEVVINPRIIARSSRVTNYGEGCLSIPGEYFNIKRFKNIKIEYLNAHGEQMLAKSRNKRQAFCFQHEIDHLNGITLITK